jgi:hypothetical protein
MRLKLWNRLRARRRLRALRYGSVIGPVPGPAQLNAQLQGFSLLLRNFGETITNYTEWFNQLATADVATYFGVTTDQAAEIQTMVGYMNTLGQVYLGQVQQGGSGGSGATLFNFNDALSALWGGG